MAFNFDGEFTVATTQEEAFAILSQTEKFAPLLPTYRSHELKDDGSADVILNVGVGKVRGTGTVNLVLTEQNKPDRARYEGKGKVMGGVFNLVAGFDLEDAGNGETLVKWDGELVIFGKLMSMAGGMIKPIAKKDIATLIEAIRIALGGEEEVVEPVAAGEPKVGWFKAFMNKLASIVRGILRIGK